MPFNTTVLWSCHICDHHLFSTACFCYFCSDNSQIFIRNQKVLPTLSFSKDIMALIHWVLRLCCLSAIPVPTSSPHVLSDTDPCSLFFRLVKLPSTLCGLPCIPVYKYKIDLFTFYDIWLQLKISFRKSCKVISIYCNIIMQGWNWPESQSKIRKLTHYLQSRPTAEIAILVCRSQGVTRSRAD